MSNHTNDRLEQLLPKFASKWDLSDEQARKVITAFPYYFTPQYNASSDRQLLNLLGKVAEYEGIHSFGGV